MIAAILNTIGLLAALAGVVLLFRYGMPQYLRGGGGEMITTEPTKEGLRLETRNEFLGYLGLALIVVGTGFQIAANFFPPN